MKKNKNVSTENKIKQFVISVAAVAVFIIVGLTILLSFLIMSNSKKILYRQVSSLVESEAKQLELSLDSYFDHVKSVASLVFSEQSFIDYVPFSSDYSDYDKVVIEKELSDQLIEYSLLDSFTDFFVCYSGNHYVGVMSGTTAASFKDGGFYTTFSSWIDNEKTKDGWMYGTNDITDRIYYVKRLNSSAVIVISFYNFELNNYFMTNVEAGNIDMCLIGNEHRIVYSSDKDAIGTMVSDREVLDFVSGDIQCINTDNSYIIQYRCNNGWKVVCRTLASQMLKNMAELEFVIVICAVASAAIAVTVMFLIIRKMFKPMDKMVSKLENKAFYDQLSKVLNKQAFKENVTNILTNAEGAHSFVFCMLDVDNFKQINDNLGHDHGDKFISKMGALLNNSFSDDNTIIGRLGGDEFAIFIESARKSDKEIIDEMNPKLTDFIGTFARVFWEESQNLNVSVSIGVTFSGDKRIEFEQLYFEADSALYKSKKSGKSQFNYYEGRDWS